MTAQLLARPAEMPVERRLTLANRVLTSSGRMDSIVRSLLDYARAKGGALVRLDREACDLADLVRRIAEEHEVAYPGRKIAVEVSGDPSGEWDPGRLEQIVANLISNAVRHGGEDGLAKAVIDGSGSDEVRVTVHNRGTPIAPEALDRIFDPFEIGPTTPGSPRKSIGLGLFIVAQLTSAHAGRVSVRSNSAEGTTFTVDLPRKPPTVPSE